MHTEYYLDNCLGLISPGSQFNPQRVIIFTDKVEYFTKKITDDTPHIMRQFRPSVGYVEVDVEGYRYFITNRSSESYRGIKANLIIIEKELNDLYLQLVVHPMLLRGGAITRLCEVRNKGQKNY